MKSFKEHIQESNVFTDARMNAIKAGKKSFIVHNKKYKITGDTSDELNAGVSEGRSVGTIPASVTKQLKKDAQRRDRNPFHQIGTQLRNNVAKINADALKKEEVELEEAHKIGSAVEIIKGSGKGIKGYIGEIRHGLYKGAPKTYTVFHSDKGAIQVPKEHIRSTNEEVELVDEASSEDELNARSGMWRGNSKRMTKKGKPTKDELGMQDNLKQRIKMQKKQGGLTGPKGQLPEQIDESKYASTIGAIAAAGYKPKIGDKIRTRKGGQISGTVYGVTDTHVHFKHPEGKSYKTSINNVMREEVEQVDEAKFDYQAFGKVSKKWMADGTVEAKSETHAKSILKKKHPLAKVWVKKTNEEVVDEALKKKKVIPASQNSYNRVSSDLYDKAADEVGNRPQWRNKDFNRSYDNSVAAVHQKHLNKFVKNNPAYAKYHK